MREQHEIVDKFFLSTKRICRQRRQKSLLVREVWSLNPEPIKSPTRY